jgi:hypothetical protein
MPIDYSKGKIYKIVDLASNECYIGSTCEPTLARRLAGHVRNFKDYKNGKYQYVTSFKIIEKGNYDIQLIENYSCENKDELHAREGHFIKQMECVNKLVPGRTKKQYYEDNVDKIKQYYKNNKEIILEKRKQYCEENQEYLKEWHKQYRKDNIDKVKEKQNQVMQCDCGKTYTRANKNKHVKTNHHLSFIANQAPSN